MKAKTPHRVLWLLAAATLAIIVYYGVVYTGQLPDHRWITGWNDVLLHAAAFALLVALVLPLSRSALVPVLALIALAAAIEVLQIPLPRRTASIRDFAASLAGIPFGVLVVGSLRAAKARLPRRRTATSSAAGP